MEAARVSGKALQLLGHSLSLPNCKMLFLLPFAFITLTTAQQVGTWQSENHPKLTWKKCTPSACESVNGEITLDANWRWLHETGNSAYNCFDSSGWDTRRCDTAENCTATCALDGADYKRSYGISTANSSISLSYVTRVDFGKNVGSRVYLLESVNKYQMFTLLGNEFAFDVNMSNVGCGLNSALNFVAMDEDGGMAKYPTNKAGAEYGTGYCDATCSRGQRFVGGKVRHPVLKVGSDVDRDDAGEQ